MAINNCDPNSNNMKKANKRRNISFPNNTVSKYRYAIMFLLNKRIITIELTINMMYCFKIKIFLTETPLNNYKFI